MASLSSKIDVVLMNQGKILKYLAPQQSIVVRPDNLPALPLTALEDVDQFEEFLSCPANFNAVVSIVYILINFIL